MKIGKVPKQTPEGPPQSSPTVGTSLGAPAVDGLERMVWQELAPRLLHPTKLAFIQLLLEAGEPRSVGELAKAVKISRAEAEHHCRKMRAAGVLIDVVSAPPQGEGEEPSYFFPDLAADSSANPSTREDR